LLSTALLLLKQLETVKIAFDQNCEKNYDVAEKAHVAYPDASDGLLET